jgi:hypothetical protein
VNELGFEITVNLLPEIVDVDINEVGPGIGFILTDKL